jgi:hypothetical protein
VLPAVKGITYSLLIRLNVLWGIGTGGFDKGTFGKSWGCHSKEEAEMIYDKLVALLDSDDPFSPFDTLTFLIGEKGARQYCGKHLGYPLRPSPEDGTSSQDPHSLFIEIDSD